MQKKHNRQSQYLNLSDGLTRRIYIVEYIDITMANIRFAMKAIWRYIVFKYIADDVTSKENHCSLHPSDSLNSFQKMKFGNWVSIYSFWIFFNGIFFDYIEFISQCDKFFIKLFWFLFIIENSTFLFYFFW